ncbi:Protein of unknown function DUF247, plant [Dillenia turbinata]|uniref:Uncharacterized protein n=1 Tax=Dillenia turbinata TaxID=194707 RepID=A0AAN8YTP2_9MAGN
MPIHQELSQFISPWETKLTSYGSTEVESLEDCIRAIELRLESIRGSYAESTDMNNENFVQMILIDSAFIIELFLLDFCYDSIDGIDSICRKPWLIDDVGRDLSLLENQLPFFILSFGSSKNIADSFLKLSYNFFEGRGNTDKFLHYLSNFEVKHFVDMLTYNYIVSSPKRNSVQQEKVKFPLSATDLLEAGIRFRKGTSRCLFRITFSHRELEIPSLKLEDGTESLFRNVIAFEQCYYQNNSYLTNYMHFLACFIKSSEDVKLLPRKRIIENQLGSHNEVVTLIQTLRKETILWDGKFYFASLCNVLATYCMGPKFMMNVKAQNRDNKDEQSIKGEVELCDWKRIGVDNVLKVALLSLMIVDLSLQSPLQMEVSDATQPHFQVVSNVHANGNVILDDMKMQVEEGVSFLSEYMMGPMPDDMSFLMI